MAPRLTRMLSVKLHRIKVAISVLGHDIYGGGRGGKRAGRVGCAPVGRERHVGRVPARDAITVGSAAARRQAAQSPRAGRDLGGVDLLAPA